MHTHTHTRAQAHAPRPTPQCGAPQDKSRSRRPASTLTLVSPTTRWRGSRLCQAWGGDGTWPGWPALPRGPSHSPSCLPCGTGPLDSPLLPGLPALPPPRTLCGGRTPPGTSACPPCPSPFWVSNLPHGPPSPSQCHRLRASPPGDSSGPSLHVCSRPHTRSGDPAGRVSAGPSRSRNNAVFHHNCRVTTQA